MFTSILPAFHHHISLYTNHLAFKAFTKEILLCHTYARCSQGHLAAAVTGTSAFSVYFFVISKTNKIDNFKINQYEQFA